MKSSKQIYLAPLQGYTSVFYRKALAKVYGGIDKYFTPFFEEGKDTFSNPDLLPELNEELNFGNNLIPQIAVNTSSFLIEFAKKIKAFGYEELNINMGCPFPMLVKRKKGGGMLSEPDLIKKLLDDYFQKDLKLKLSIKMRTGLNDQAQGSQIISILNQYPIEEVIIHPRLVTQKYKGEPDWNAFEHMMSSCQLPVVANGDIVNQTAMNDLAERFPNIKGVMIGRGILADPAIILKKSLTRKEKIDLFQELHNVFYNLIEENTINWNQAYNYFNDFWFYPLSKNNESKRYFRKLKKHNSINLYKDWLGGVWDYLYLESEEL
nr:tRNA-dihydrouridine synthase family protein [uncultured Carboxylicivirga sp.]